MPFKPIQITCKNCGAALEMDPTLRMVDCSFCGSHLIITGGYKTEGKYPQVNFIFQDKISEKTYEDMIRNFLCDSIYTPDDLYDALDKRQNYLCYLPFYLFNVDWSVGWTAEKGYIKQRKVPYQVKDYYPPDKDGVRREKGSHTEYKMESYTEWSPASGVSEGRCSYSALANKSKHSSGFIKKIMNVVDSLDMKKAIRFEQQYLDGMTWIGINEDQNEAYKQVSSRVYDSIIFDCRRRSPGDKVRNIHFVDRRKKNINYQSYMYPFWLFSYVYQGKSYTIVIDAVFGNFQGDKPENNRKTKIKFFLFTPLIISCLCLFALFVSPPPIGTGGVIVIFCAFVSMISALLLPNIYKSKLTSTKNLLAKGDKAQRIIAVNKMADFERQFLLMFFFIIGTLLLLFTIVAPLVGHMEMQAEEDQKKAIAEQQVKEKIEREAAVEREAKAAIAAIEAERLRQEEVRRQEIAKRAEVTLKEAEHEKSKGNWAEVYSLAEKVLEFDPENSRAKRLKTEADQHSQ